MRHRQDPMDAPAPPMPLWNLARAASRSSDPDTSRMAAEAAEVTGAAAAQRRRCLEAVREHPGSTAAEVARFLGMERHAPSRRLPELRAAGLLVNGAARICGVTGNQSITWRPA